MTVSGNNPVRVVNVLLGPSTAMNPAMLATDGVITVTGPNGYAQPGHLTGLIHNGDGSYLATYSVPPNGGSWDFRDTGVYAVRINAGRALDFAGRVWRRSRLGIRRRRFTQPAAVIELPTFPTRTQWDFVIDFLDERDHRFDDGEHGERARSGT